MKGVLQKPGKRTKVRVTRFFQLEGTVLSSHRAEGAAATWTVSIADSILTGNDSLLEIHVEIPDMKTITLYAESVEMHHRWMQALENAVARKFEIYYESGAFLGQGSTSVVKAAINTVTGDHVAAKFIDKGQSRDRYGEDELKSLRAIRHPHIVEAYDVFESDTQFIVVMEHLQKGLLYDVLCTQLPSEVTISHCVQQILAAVNHIHANGLVHRNLKPENVFATGDYQPYHVKIADGGIRNWYRVDEEGKDPEISAIGDEIYLAPEVVMQRNYSAMMDSWSIGMLTYHLLVGRAPFSGRNWGDIDWASSELRNVSESGVSFMRALLEQNEKQRMSVTKALEHPWIVDGEYLSSKPVGNRLHGLSSTQRNVTKKLTIANDRLDQSYRTTGSYQRNIPDVLVYGSRSVTDPGAYSVNRDPWGGKAAASHSKGLLRSSRSIAGKRGGRPRSFGSNQAASDQARSDSFQERERSAGRSSRGLFRSRSSNHNR